jgi:hypothetical protein
MLLCSVLSDYFGARSHVLHVQRCSISASRSRFVSGIAVAASSHSDPNQRKEIDGRTLHDRILLVALARESEALGEWRDVVLRRASLERMLARSTADFAKETPAMTLKAVSASSAAATSSVAVGGNSSAFSVAALGWIVCAWSRRVLTMMHALRCHSALRGDGNEAPTVAREPDAGRSDSMEWLTCDMTSMYASDDDSDDDVDESESQDSVSRSKAPSKPGIARRAAKSIIDDNDEDDDSAASALDSSSSRILPVASSVGQSADDRVRSVCLALVSQCSLPPPTASSSSPGAPVAPNPLTMSSWLTETHASFIGFVHDAMRESRFAALEMAKIMATAAQRSGTKSDVFSGLRASASSLALAPASAPSNSKSAAAGNNSAMTGAMSAFSSADARRLVADSDSDAEARAGGYSDSESDGSDGDDGADDDGDRVVDHDGGDDDDREFGANYRRALKKRNCAADSSVSSSSNGNSKSNSVSSSRHEWAAWLSRSWAKLDSQLRRIPERSLSDADAGSFDTVLAEALGQVRQPNQASASALSSSSSSSSLSSSSSSPSSLSSSSSLSAPLPSAGPWSSPSLVRAPALIAWLRASVPIDRPALLARADRRFRKWMVCGFLSQSQNLFLEADWLPWFVFISLPCV